MEIFEWSAWNRFRVPIVQKPQESDMDYLARVKGCLVAFYEKHTSTSQENRKYFDPFRDCSLESLATEHNFCYMHLEGIHYCDVKFFVDVESKTTMGAGIDILCHGDNPERRKPMIDFVRKKWKEFDYKF